MKTLLNFLLRSFFFSPCAAGDAGVAGDVTSSTSDDGAAASAPGASATEEELLGELEGLPASALEADPEYKKMIEDDLAAKKGKPAKKNETPAEEENPEGSAEETPEGSTEETPEDKSQETPEDEAIEFADDVIPGVKGEQLKALPQETVASLADFVTGHTKLEEEAKEAKTQLEKLLADPITKRRMDLITAGKAEYEVRGINATEKRSMINAIIEAGDLTQDEAAKVYGKLEEGISQVIKEAAGDMFQKYVDDEGKARFVEDRQRKGRQLFLELGKFNKSLAFKENDASKFWGKDGTLDDSHPEAKTFKEKILPIMTSLRQAGETYDSLLSISERYGTQAVYALIATKFGYPIAVNTEERDKKIVASELKKRLAPFVKSSTAKGLSERGEAAIPSAKTPKGAVIKHGYDIVRLAQDGDYYENALKAKAGNRAEHMALVERLAEEGQAILDRKQSTQK